MNRKKNTDLVLAGAVAAAAFLMAPEAHATAWCPTPNDHIISCNGCSRELNCDPYNQNITITGNSVNLDGKGHWSYYSPNYGVEDQGYGNTIKYLNIQGAGIVGIIIKNWNYTGLSTNVDHCTIVGSGTYGIANASGDPVSVSYSTITYSGANNVSSQGSRGVDFRQSVSNYAASYGYKGDGVGAWILQTSTFAYNGQYGLFANGGSGWLVTGSNFGNDPAPAPRPQKVGLYLFNASGTVTRNYGRDDAQYDCQESHTVPVSISHYGNNWGTSSGSGCSP